MVLEDIADKIIFRGAVGGAIGLSGILLIGAISSRVQSEMQPLEVKEGMVIESISSKYVRGGRHSLGYNLNTVNFEDGTVVNYSDKLPFGLIEPQGGFYEGDVLNIKMSHYSDAFGNTSENFRLREYQIVKRNLNEGIY
jgi:hypothetical protein